MQFLNESSFNFPILKTIITLCIFDKHSFDVFIFLKNSYSNLVARKLLKFSPNLNKLNKLNDLSIKNIEFLPAHFRAL